MVGIKLTDPHSIVTAMLTDYANAQLKSSSMNKTAESFGHLLAGMRISRYYRRDISEQDRNVIAHEFLRGVLADHAV